MQHSYSTFAAAIFAAGISMFVAQSNAESPKRVPPPQIVHVPRNESPTADAERALVGAEIAGDPQAALAALDRGAPDPADRALDINAKDGLGGTRLGWAVVMCDVHEIKALLDEGADVNITAIGGMTPLMSAVINNKLDCINLFVAAGADLDFTDDKGRTVFQRADPSHPEIIAALNSAKSNAKANVPPRSCTATAQSTESSRQCRLTMLTTIANEDPKLWIRRAAIARLDDEARLTGFSGEMTKPTADSLQAVARISLALKNPVIAARIPQAKVVLVWEEAGRAYRATTVSGASSMMTPTTVGGETVMVFVRQGRKTLAQDIWKSNFPSALPYGTSFVPVVADAAGVLTQLLRAANVSRQDLVELNQSAIPELRAAAAADLP
jgi:hypothetical protein